MATEMRRLAALLGMLLAASAAGAGERALESFDVPGRFARVSGGGLLEFGREDERAWVRCTTPGDGEPVLVARRRPYDPPLDLSGRFPKVWLKVSDVKRLAGMEFQLFSDTNRSQAFVFPIPVFADEQFNLLQSGEWVPVTLSFGAARVVGSPDRASIREIAWLLRDRGSPGSAQPVEVYWGGLAAVDEAAHGVVSLTFDDGLEEHLSVAAPAMAAHGLRGTAYVMPEQVDVRGYMNREELHALRERYGWDVAAHHNEPYTGRSPEELEAVIRSTRDFLRAEGLGAGVDHLAYPLGKYDADTVLPLVRRYFATARLASAGPETLPPADPHRLRVMNVLSTTTPEEIREASRRAMHHGEWLILMFHYLVEEPARDTEYRVRDFLRVVEQLDDDEIDVRTVSEVWSAFGSEARTAAPAP